MFEYMHWFSNTPLNRNCVAKSGATQNWRNANICHIYKSGEKSDITNYRPILLLSVASKVAERYIFNRIYPLLHDQIYTL